jgi:hypothetical protein
MRMKKISLFALALVTGVVLNAQESDPQLRTSGEVKTRFGIRAGVNLASVNLSEGNSVSEGAVNGANSKTSYNAGILVNVPLGATAFRFQPELNFSSQGARFLGGSGAGFSYEQDLNYLNVPLNFQLTAKNGLFVQTGPQVGFLMSANTKDATGTGAPTNGENKGSFDKIDLAWSAGVGYLSRAGLGIDARYNMGLRNLREDNAPAMMQGNWRNNVGQISLIYQFGGH